MGSPQYVSSCGFSDLNYERKLFHNACTGVASHYVSPCAFSDVNFERKLLHKTCTGMTSPQYVLINGSQDNYFLRIFVHNSYIDMAFPHYVSSCDFLDWTY